MVIQVKREESFNVAEQHGKVSESSEFRVED